jgi:tRNA-2-methylthio-N6-dimethylallyladenosine synthase
MNTTSRAYRVDRREIHYIRSTIESYDGMALVRTLDPGEAVLEVLTAPGCEELVSELVRRLEREEGLRMAPIEAGETVEAGRRAAGPSRFAVITMGCQMNEYDSEYAARCLTRSGLAPTPDPEEADVIVVNTCSVRAKAEQKALSTLGRMSAVKRRRPDTVLVFAGCVAQQQGSALLDRFPELDVVLGTRGVHRVADLVERVRATGERLVETDLETGERLPAPPAVHREGGRVKGFITVMQGCDNFCSYCIVPYVRGREKSRSPGEIAAEARDLLTRGVREITLLGQNVNSYAWEEGGTSLGFADLLRRLDRLPGLERLRFTTSHPKDLTDELIRCFGELEHLCGHIHLPFQAGSNRVLARMNRRYTREGYLALVERLREARPGIGLTADVMVGFPGESREAFEETLSLIRAVRFDNLYSFKYSDRLGTEAAGFEDKVREAEKADRLERLQSIQKRITLEKNRALEGREMAVLVEGRSKRGDQYTGRTDCNRVVNFTSDSELMHRLVHVIIQEGCAHSLRGTLREPPQEARA